MGLRTYTVAFSFQCRGGVGGGSLRYALKPAGLLCNTYTVVCPLPLQHRYYGETQPFGEAGRYVMAPPPLLKEEEGVDGSIHSNSCPHVNNTSVSLSFKASAPHQPPAE